MGLRVRRPSPAMLVACLALFVALAGTAAATVIVSSNGQIAKNTISGHRPPAGDHANIVAGSITSADVAQDSLTGKAINESTLGPVPSATHADHATNANRLGGSAASAFQLRISHSCSNGSAIASVQSNGGVSCANEVVPIKLDPAAGSSSSATIGDFKVLLVCRNSVSQLEFSNVNSWTVNYFYGSNTNSTEGVANSGGGGLILLAFTGSQAQGQFILSDANQELTVNMSAVDNFSSCQGRGTAELAAN